MRKDPGKGQREAETDRDRCVLCVWDVWDVWDLLPL